MKSLSFFVLDMCSKTIFCLKVAQKGKICQPRFQGSLLPPTTLVTRFYNLLEVARTAKSCSKRQKMLKSCRAQSGKA